MRAELPNLAPILSGVIDWAARLSPEDYRGLTPLIYAHINPYGRFDVDLDRRIDFDRLAA